MAPRSPRPRPATTARLLAEWPWDQSGSRHGLGAGAAEQEIEFLTEEAAKFLAELPIEIGHHPVGGTFARGGSSTPYGNLQEDAMSDQTDLIRGTLDC